MYVSLHILTQHRAGREGSQRHGRGVQQGQQHDGTEHAGALEKKNTTEWGKMAHLVSVKDRKQKRCQTVVACLVHGLSDRYPELMAG